jgi:hypothetical protein
MIKRRNKKGLQTKPVKGKAQAKAKAKPRLVAKTKARQRKRVHRVARGKPKPGHEISSSDQLQDREDPRRHPAADPARPRRRVDRIDRSLLRLLTAAYGTFRTCQPRQTMSGFRG